LIFGFFLKQKYYALITNVGLHLKMINTRRKKRLKKKEQVKE
jgi:hypothetical protein